MKHFSRAAIVIAVGTAWPAMAGVPATTTSTLSTVTSTTTSTTTTTLAPACIDAATFDSILCRLDEQSAIVQSSPDLGKTGAKLAGALSKATSATNKASDSCNSADSKASGKQLKKAIRRMIQYNHRLGSLKSRKNLPEPLRTDLLTAGKSIQNDMQSLKKNLICPPPGSPSPAFL